MCTFIQAPFLYRDIALMKEVYLVHMIFRHWTLSWVCGLHSCHSHHMVGDTTLSQQSCLPLTLASQRNLGRKTRPVKAMFATLGLARAFVGVLPQHSFVSQCHLRLLQNSATGLRTSIQCLASSLPVKYYGSLCAPHKAHNLHFYKFRCWQVLLTDTAVKGPVEP